jgi:hypothetical protein
MARVARGVVMMTKRAMVMVTTWVMSTATRVGVNEEGDGKEKGDGYGDNTGDGDGNKGGEQQ